jgi:hypothetical protein
MTYGLNSEAPAFSYTREELFSCITKIVSHSSSAESRALAILTVFDYYFSNFLESDNNGGYYVAERDATDFIDFVRFKLGIDDYDYVSTDEVLK